MFGVHPTPPRTPRRGLDLTADTQAPSTVFLALRRIRTPFVVLVVLFAVSVLRLTLIPGQDADGQPWRMSIFDTLCFMIYTATTIGFGETPYAFSVAQRRWVTFSIYLAVVGWAYAVGYLLALLQDRGFRQALATRRFGRQVAHLREPFLLLAGCGRTGSPVGRSLDAGGQRFAVVDLDSERIDALDIESFRADVPGLAADAGVLPPAGSAGGSPAARPAGERVAPMRRFRRDGLTFDVLDAGPPDGDPVVLLHGFPQGATAWRDVTPALHAAGLRTLAPDQRGYSPGARPTGSAAYRWRELVDDVRALLDAAGAERAHVVGHDWGGGVAWALAAAHPERVRTLTVVSTPHPAALRRSLLRGQLLRSWYMGLFQVPGLAERLIAPGGRFWAALVRDLPADHAATYAERMRDPAARTAALAWYRAIPAETARPSLHVGRIDVPTLYVWGDRDPALGAAAARATADFVSGPYRFEVLRGAGHWIPETRGPDLTVLLLEHLRP